MIDRVLIYRLGSIGDTVVALPSFRLVARAFPQAKRVLLTMLPRSHEAAPQLILKGMGLVDGYMAYNPGERNSRNLLAVRSNVRDFRPDALIYMNQSRGTAKDLRDLFFFRASGVRKVIGAPRWKDLRQHRFDSATRLFESEAHRIARCLSPLGDARVDDPANWDLDLTVEERAEVKERLARWPGARHYFAISVGSKIAAKDWGETAWRTVVERLGKEHPTLGLVLIGGREDHERSARISTAWPGPAINLSGLLSPRVSAAVLAQAVVFVGGDGGPMHLASTVGTRCVVVFGEYNQPGVWHPLGRHHRVIHERSLTVIDPDRVVREVSDALFRTDPGRRQMIGRSFDPRSPTERAMT
jgi:heptosyltransferase III